MEEYNDPYEKALALAPIILSWDDNKTVDEYRQAVLEWLSKNFIFILRSLAKKSAHIDALKMIAGNTCCDNCREAALVAQEALDKEY